MRQTEPQHLYLLKRAYATTTKAAAKPRATKPAAKKTTKKAVKKVTKKVAKVAKPKAKPKKKVVVKKAKKPLTDAQKEKLAVDKNRETIKQLKVVALLDEPKKLPYTAYLVLQSETSKGVKMGGSKGLIESSVASATKYKSFTAAEREVNPAMVLYCIFPDVYAALQSHCQPE
jgi:hypothetical protein